MYLCLIIKNYNIKKLIKSEKELLIHNYQHPIILIKKPTTLISNKTHLNLFFQETLKLKKLTLNEQWALYIYLQNLSYQYLNIKLNWKFINIQSLAINKNFLLKLWYKIYKKKIFGIFYGKKKKLLHDFYNYIN